MYRPTILFVENGRVLSRLPVHHKLFFFKIAVNIRHNWAIQTWGANCCCLLVVLSLLNTLTFRSVEHIITGKVNSKQNGQWMLEYKLVLFDTPSKIVSLTILSCHLMTSISNDRGFWSSSSGEKDELFLKFQSFLLRTFLADDLLRHGKSRNGCGLWNVL